MIHFRYPFLLPSMRDIRKLAIPVMVLFLAVAFTRAESQNLVSASSENTTAGKTVSRIKQFDKTTESGFTKKNDAAAPSAFALSQNFPNPFNPSTNISFTVPYTGHVTLKIFNVIGKEVATLFEGEAQAGVSHQVVFKATDFTSGIYFSRLEHEGSVLTQKMTLIK